MWANIWLHLSAAAGRGIAGEGPSAGCGNGLPEIGEIEAELALFTCDRDKRFPAQRGYGVSQD